MGNPGKIHKVLFFLDVIRLKRLKSEEILEICPVVMELP